MGEFFKFVYHFFDGWRKRIGLLTLVLALMLVAAMIRSRHYFDSIGLNGNPFRFVIASCDSRLHLFRTGHISEHPYIRPYPFFRYFSIERMSVIGFRHKDSKGNVIRTYEPHYREVEWRRDLAGFHASAFTATSDLQVSGFNSPTRPLRIDYLAIPYWSLVVPLTLFSAYLLLTRPMKSMQKKTLEPISEKVA